MPVFPVRNKFIRGSWVEILKRDLDLRCAKRGTLGQVSKDLGQTLIIILKCGHIHEILKSEVVKRPGLEEKPLFRL